MLDIKFIRENKDLIALGARKKHIDFNVEHLIAADDKRRAFLAEVEEMKARQNQASKEIQQTDDMDKRAQLIASMKVLKEMIHIKEESLKAVLEEWQKLMVHVPNIPDMSVPEGKTTRTIKRSESGERSRNFLFTPKKPYRDHGKS